MEDPKLTRKIVRREVTRVLTPGTALDSALGQEQNNFLAALYETGPAKEPVCAIALLDVSTGEFRTAEFRGPTARQQAVDELLKADPSEVLLGSSAEMPAQLERIPARTRVEDWVWTRDFAVPLVERQLNVRTLEGFGLTVIPRPPSPPEPSSTTCAPRRRIEALHIDSLKFEEHSHCPRTRPSHRPQSRIRRAALSGQDDRVTLFQLSTPASRPWASGCCAPRSSARSSSPGPRSSL